VKVTSLLCHPYSRESGFQLGGFECMNSTFGYEALGNKFAF